MRAIVTFMFNHESELVTSQRLLLAESGLSRTIATNPKQPFDKPAASSAPNNYDNSASARFINPPYSSE
jgi:hypothetical protein